MGHSGRTRCLVVSALIGGWLLLPAGGPLSAAGRAAAQPAPPVVTVDMKDFLFMPATITIKPGTIVRWVYDESATDPTPNCETPGVALACPGHTATAVKTGPNGQPLFSSPTLKKSGASYSFTFAGPGTFQYYCVYHGGPHPNNPLTHMDGTIVVAAGTAATSTSGSASSGAPAVAANVKSASISSGVASPAATMPNTGGPFRWAWALAALALVLALRMTVRLPADRVLQGSPPVLSRTRRIRGPGI